MALKRKIDKATFDAFAGDAAWQKSAYKVDPADANSYVLDAENDEGLDKALRAKQHEVDQHNETKAKLTAAEKERDANKTKAEGLEAEKRAGWKKDPDRDAIEADLNAKLTAEKEARQNDVETSNKKFSDYIRDNEASKLAETISTVPTMMARELRDRITVDLSGDSPVVRVLDKDGRPSATSLQELSKEFVDNPSYKAVIKASDASGGGAGPGNNGGGGAQPKAFKDMNEAERTVLFKSNPAEFQRLSNENRAASAGYR